MTRKIIQFESASAAGNEDDDSNAEVKVCAPMRWELFLSLDVL